MMRAVRAVLCGLAVTCMAPLAAAADSITIIRPAPPAAVATSTFAFAPR